MLRFKPGEGADDDNGAGAVSLLKMRSGGMDEGNETNHVDLETLLPVLDSWASDRRAGYKQVSPTLGIEGSQSSLPFATTISILPKVSAALSTQFLTESGSAISTLVPTARAPPVAPLKGSNSLPVTTREQYETLAPSARKASVMTLPIPLRPPVYKIVRRSYEIVSQECVILTCHEDVGASQLRSKTRHDEGYLRVNDALE